MRYVDPDGRFEKTAQLEMKQRELTFSEYSILCQDISNQVKLNEERSGITSFVLTIFGIIKPESKLISILSTMVEIQSISPDKLIEIDKQLNLTNNKILQSIGDTGEIPNIKITETTTLTAKNKTSNAYAGPLTNLQVVERSIIKQTSIEVSIGNEILDSISISEESKSYGYADIGKLFDFTWAVGFDD